MDLWGALVMEDVGSLELAEDDWGPAQTLQRTFVDSRPDQQDQKLALEQEQGPIAVEEVGYCPFASVRRLEAQEKDFVLAIGWC